MTADSQDVLTRAAATNDDILALVDRAIMYIANDDPDARSLTRRLSILNNLAPVALLGSGNATHLPRPARALATFIHQATYDEHDWIWAKQALTALQVDPDALLIATRRAVPESQNGHMRALLPRADYTFIPVDRLPFAHNPFKCSHIDRHQEFERQAQRRQRSIFARLRRRSSQDEAPALAAGRHLDQLLSTGELPTCHMHPQGVDWRLAIDQARHIQDTVTPWTEAAIDAALDIATDEDSTTQQRLVRDLFTDAIRCNRTFSRLQNGQHRVCGARRAGIPTLLIAWPVDERPANLDQQD